MGTTVQVEQNRWSFLDARLFVAGTATSGIGEEEVRVASKKYGDFSFSTKPLNGTLTEVDALVSLGATTITLTDTTIFPRTAGTLIIDPGGVNEIIDFTSNPISAPATLNIPSGIQTPAGFAAGVDVKFSYATEVTYSVTAGTTGVIVDDSSIFPPGFGRVRLYNATTSEIIELSSNLESANTLGFKTGLVNPFTAGDKVELIEWYELTSGPVGYYSILFSPGELNTLDQFLYTIITYAGPPLPGVTIDEFERTIDVIRATSVESEAAPALSTCVIKDHIADLSGAPIENVSVSARLLALPTLVSGVGVNNQIVTAVTDTNGFFQMTLIQGATVDVIIPSTGYRRTIVVPSTTSANLFEI